MPIAPSARLRAITAFLAISAGLISFTSLEFMLEAIQKEFSMTSDETMVVSQIAAGACLLAVFLTGALCDRLGERRVMTAASGLFGLGACIIGIAPHAAVLLLGLSIGGVGTIAMAIVGLSVLNTTFPEKGRRARAFGQFAVVAPAVAIFVPIVSASIVPALGWRLVTLLWIAVAATTALLARRALTGGPDEVVHLELVTPTFAGLALSAVALTFSFLKIDASTQHHADDALVCAIVAGTAFIALVMAMRSIPRPTLDLRSLRMRGALPVFAAVFVMNGINLFFFTYLVLQYRYHQSLGDTALMLVLPQATAAAGAVLGGRLAVRWGSPRVATLALLCASIVCTGAFVVSADSQAWVPVVFLAVVAVPISAAVGPLTQSVMDLAPADGAGATSSMRNSAANLGVAVAGLVSATIIFDDLDADTARTIEAYRQQAGAFHLASLMCSVAYLVAAGLMIAHMRRRSTLHLGGATLRTR